MYRSKRLLARAEKLFWQGNWCEAEALFIAACEQAEQSLRASELNAETIETALLCYHRLAGCFLTQGRVHAAQAICEQIQVLLTARLYRTETFAQFRRPLERACLKAARKLNDTFGEPNVFLPG